MNRHHEFLQLLAGAPVDLPLDAAALELAALDHGPIDRDGCLRMLDAWAADVAALLPPEAEGAAFLSAMNRCLVRDLGFRGDTENYYDPANSCLDLVLVRRRGLPITLAVIYMEVARRLGRTIEGLALPAHFLCRYTGPEGITIYIDPFHGGELMTEEDCVQLIERATSMPLQFDPATVPAASPRLILHRMLNNLKYAREAAEGRS